MWEVYIISRSGALRDLQRRPQRGVRHRAQRRPGDRVRPRALHRVQRHRHRHPLPGACGGV